MPTTIMLNPLVPIFTGHKPVYLEILKQHNKNNGILKLKYFI